MSRRPRRLPALLVLALLVLLAGCNASISPPTFRHPDPSLVTQAALEPCPSVAKDVRPAKPLSKVTLHCLGAGPSVSLAHLRGPAIVNAWYSACDPCQQEAPILAKFEAAAKGKVLMLGVDSEAYPNPALEFIHKYGLHFAMLSDQHSDFAVGNFPSTYFLDAHGNVVGAPLSPIASLQQLEDEVRTRLGVTVS